MRVELTASFLKSAEQLPPALKPKLARQLEFLRERPFHPLLHAKPLSGQLAGFWSFRLTRDYRVIFLFINADVIKIVLAGHRKDIYR